MKLYNIRYFLMGSPVTAIVKEESLGKAIIALEKNTNEHDNFTLISADCLDNKTGILFRDYEGD